MVDGTYELFRSYYGAPPRQTSNGLEVGALQGLLASMISLLRDERVTHIAVATDHIIESFRNDLFAGYKTGEGMPENLTAQFIPTEEGLRALGITVYAMIEFEADDALSSAAYQYKSLVDKVYICTPDKDLMQMVGENIVCVDRRRGIEYDEAGVIQKFGIQPSSIPDYLGLVGDTADGIPGLPGWGAKSASQMLALFGSIEKFPANLKEWPRDLRSREKLYATYKQSREKLDLYKTLAMLRLDVPLGTALENLKYTGPNQKEWERFCNQYEIQEQIITGGINLIQSAE